MQDILSKVSASGLSAGVFLLWWPVHITSQGSEALLARGVLWALAFEVLLLGFRPLERAVGRAVKGREAGMLAPRRIAPVLALATVAAVVPVTMLCGARAPLTAPARAAAPKVIVKREIVRREVVVRRVSKIVRVPVPAATTPAATPATPARTVRTTAARPATTTAATPKKTSAPAEAQTDTTADTKADATASTTTTAKPAVTATTTQPTTTTATPAATTAAATAAATKPAGS